MLLKYIFRVGRAANDQSTTDMENYESRPLNKPITAIGNKPAHLKMHN